MNRSKLRLSAHLFGVVIAVIILISCSTAGAQTTSTAPTETAPATAPAPPAKKPAKPLTPAQVAAQEKAEAAREAREERAAQKAQTVAAKTAATPAAKTATAKTAAAKSATATTAATPTATPATATSAAGSSALSRTAPTGTSGSAAAVGTGTLAWGPRVYTSTGCVHNGSSAVCTFTFVNQGNAATLAAGGAGELSGIQFVDDAHVPHRWDTAYFMDKYNAQQKRLLVQPGDTGTYVVVFPNVDAQVASAEFHLRQQVVGGITVGAAPSNSAASKPTTSTASNTK
jgi:hypothetical protein